jgi:hypothetical protein
LIGSHSPPPSGRLLRSFNLCAAYLWPIHDYLTYDKFVGWHVHGRLNCPVCIDDSDAFRLQHSGKVCFFDCHQRFLPLSHEFRGDKQSFLKDKIVRKGPPKRKLRVDIVKILNDFKESENGGFEGYGEKHNWIHKSCLWELPYTNVLILPHNINLMHQESNIAESIISMCFDVTDFLKDNINARKDLAATTFFFATDSKTFVPHFNCCIRNTSQCRTTC